MTHPPLCVCPACGTRRETVASKEIVMLKALVRELAGALDIFADACDDLAVEDLIKRAREAGAP